MGLVTGCARAWQRDGGDDVTVIRSAFIAVHDGQEVGINASLISGPDIKRFFPLLPPFVFLFFLLSSIGSWCGSPCASTDGHHAQTEQRCHEEERCRFQKLAAAGNYSNHDLCS